VIFQQHAQTEAIDAAVVGDHGQALDATALDFGDEVFRDPAEAEAARKHGHVVGKPIEGFFVCCHSLVESSHGDPAFFVVVSDRAMAG
jgi:hypothetical protein